MDDDGAGDRRQRVIDALTAEPNCSDRSLARRLGLNNHFVGGIRRELERTGTLPRLATRFDANGRKQPARRRTA